MKKTILFVIAFVFCGGCARVTLIDQTLNSFTATATKDLDTKVVVSWITNQYYSGYQVIRSETSNGTYIPISEVISGGSFDDASPVGSPVFYYKVRGFNSVGFPIFTTAEPAEGYINGFSVFSPPTTFKASLGESSSKIILRWERVPDAVKYTIFRSRDPQGPFNIILVTTPYLEYEDNMGDNGKPMNPGDVYYYKILSVNADGDPSANSYPYGTNGMMGRVFGGYAGLTAETGVYYDKVVLRWNALPDVTEYIIYRASNENAVGEQFAVVKAGAETTYTDKTLSATDVFYYTLFYRGANANNIVQDASVVEGYYKTDTAPARPQNFSASEGEDAQYIILSWDPVPGAISYKFSRASSPQGPWESVRLTLSTNASTGKVTAKDDPYENARVEAFSYYYQVVGLNPGPGEYSEIKQGWANKAPVNITASSNYGGRVKLNWDSVPGATSYQVSYSPVENGSYIVAGDVTPTGQGREEFNHRVEIQPDFKKNILLQGSGKNSRGSSDPSNPIAGVIAKIEAPKNLVVRNNTAPEDTLKFGWDPVLNATKYRVYRAVLMHRNATVADLKESDYSLIAEVNNNAYQDTLIELPIRRYDYKILAVDPDGDNGAAVYTKNVVNTADKSTYRLPKDVLEFLQDVDISIIEAQTRIPNFGANGSGGAPKARAFGYYDYYAGTSAKSRWDNYTSFEITLNGNPSFSINMGDFSATQSGTVTITGLFSGTVTYNALKGAMGGFTTGGSITAVYNHPRGRQSQTYDGPTTAAAYLRSVRSTSEPAPVYPTYVKGGGGTIQPGGRD